MMSQRFNSLIERVKNLIHLYLDSAKLTLSEKVTILLSAAVVLVVCVVLSIFALAFLSGACIELLGLILPLWASYAIMGGFFILLILLTLLLRRPFIVNPIARFMTRLVFDHHETKKSIKE